MTLRGSDPEWGRKASNIETVGDLNDADLQSGSVSDTDPRAGGGAGAQNRVRLREDDRKAKGDVRSVLMISRPVLLRQNHAFPTGLSVQLRTLRTGAASDRRWTTTFVDREQTPRDGEGRLQL